MPVTRQENERYRVFVSDVAKEMGVFDGLADQIVWHYTNGAGFLGILQSSTIFATQVSCLNDVRETKYGSDLYKEAVKQLIEERAGVPEDVAFLRRVLEFVKEEPDSPTHGTSKFFVTCFSGYEDDVTQWDRYGGENGYAIGFYARGLWREPNSQIYRVVYDRDKQLKAARKITQATLDFYKEGINDERSQDVETWGREFFAAWDEWVYKLAPLAKDAGWKNENEFRIVHELKPSEFARVRFTQKKTMLARYLPLDTPQWVKRRIPLLPLAKIIVGHGNHPAFTPVSVRLLLDQMGYSNVPVEVTKSGFVRV